MTGNDTDEITESSSTTGLEASINAILDDPRWFRQENYRLDQLLARFGYCGRREAGSWIKRGRVTTLDGEVLKDAGKKVRADQVLVQGFPVPYAKGLFVAFHKPVGYVCSHDEREGGLIYDLLPPEWADRNPPVASVGRLDKETSGLLLITDSGALIHDWTSPKHEVEKDYAVTVESALQPFVAKKLAAGTLVLHGEEKPCHPARFVVTGEKTGVLTLTEGRYHQVRRMFHALGHEVLALHRTRIGNIELGDLPVKQWLAAE